MNITRRIVEEKRIIVTYDIVFNGEVASLSFIAELGGQYDRFNARFQLYTKENDYSGHLSNLNLWNVYNKESDSDYVYTIPKSILSIVQDEFESLRLELTGISENK